MGVEVVGDIKDVEPIADGRQIRELPRLQKLYGGKNWRKKKGIATVRLPELHYVKPRSTGTRPMASVE